MSSPSALYEHRPIGLESEELLQSGIDTLTQSLQATFGSLPPDEFAAVVDLLANPRRRILLRGGRFSHILAHDQLTYLHQLRSGCRPPVGPRARFDALIDVGKRDVLVVFDYQDGAVAFAYRAAKQGATPVLFTDPWLSPIAEVAQHILPSPSDWLVAALTRVETLLAGLVTELCKPARDRSSDWKYCGEGFARRNGR